MPRYTLFFTLFFNCVITIKSNAQSNHPNIIIILADDQGWGDLGFNGNKTVNTPNLDQLAKEGIVLDRFYVSPVCSPTRAELLTGRYHVRGGVTGTSSGFERLDLDEVTFAEVFKKNGYRTGVFGKWHNGGQAPYHPNTRGFDEFYGFCAGHWAEYFNPILEHNGEIIQGKGFIIDDLTSQGIQFIENNKETQFLAYFPYNTPHSPMQVPDEYWGRYENKPLAQQGSHPELEDSLHTKAALAMTENIDWNVGRIIQKLEELNLMNNTIVIYFSDNGPNGHRWNGHMKGIKGNTDEGGIRSPFIIQWKGKLAKGTTVNNITSVLDIFPTLVELADIENQQTKPFDGLSLKNLLTKNQDVAINDRIIPSYWSGKTSIRSERFRLSSDLKLYDMQNDPDQTSDISKTHPDDYKKLLAWKDEWIRTVLNELPENDTRPFTVGDSKLELTILPTSEATGKGNVIRSNKYPNSSFFRQFRNSEDEISWPVAVQESGVFEIEVYYGCSDANIGSELIIEFEGSTLTHQLSASNEKPLIGMENDRVLRMESYTKDFLPMKFGRIALEKGEGKLKLRVKSLKKPDDLEINLITLRRID